MVHGYIPTVWFNKSSQKIHQNHVKKFSGEDEFIKYHHMGKAKYQSLSNKEASLFETMVRIAIQIVWISLGRKCYNEIGKNYVLLYFYKNAEYNNDRDYKKPLKWEQKFKLSVDESDCVSSNRLMLIGRIGLSAVSLQSVACNLLLPR